MGSPQTFSRFRFGFGRLADDSSGLAMPVLGGAEEETLFNDASALGTEGGFSLFAKGDWLRGFWVGEAGPDLGAKTRDLYSEMLRLTRARGCSLARIWNYVPEINEASPEGLENYRVFCRGRAQALESAPEREVPPAASAVGGVAGRLAVLFAAASTAALRESRAGAGLRVSAGAWATFAELFPRGAGGGERTAIHLRVGDGRDQRSRDRRAGESGGTDRLHAR